MANIKSVDVGSIFLMDLSVNESDTHVESEPVDTGAISSFVDQALSSGPSQALNSGPSQPRINCDINNKPFKLAYQSPPTQRFGCHRRLEFDNSIDDSLKRIASAIDHHHEDYYDNHKLVNQNNSLTTVEPSSDISDHQLALSLSDSSFITSSDESISVSYTGSIDNEEHEKASTTTREDSGVIDVKDLELNSTSDNKHDYKSKETHHHHHHHRNNQEKPISKTDIEATNLIMEPVNNLNDDNGLYNQAIIVGRSRKPTNHKNSNNINDSNRQNTNHNQYHNHSSKRSMSASLPIQVPARQMKSDLNKLKLELIKDDREGIIEVDRSIKARPKGEKPECPTDTEDVDDFLEQEYNENHNNHYPIDEFDEQPPRADDDPMRLFESIQALARSLHKDAELFGSLPPKRLLASPLRSLALA